MGIIIFCALLVFTVIWAVNYYKTYIIKKKKRLMQFAQKKGLHHYTYKTTTVAGPRLNTIEGNLNGFPIRIFETYRFRNHPCTRIEFSNTPFDYDFSINKNDSFIMIMRSNLLGKDIITFGNPTFDKKFLLKSNDKEKLKVLMTHNLQNELISIEDVFRKGSIQNSKDFLLYECLFHYGGHITKLANEKELQSLERIIDFMIKLLKTQNHRARPIVPPSNLSSAKPGSKILKSWVIGNQKIEFEEQNTSFKTIYTVKIDGIDIRAEEKKKLGIVNYFFDINGQEAKLSNKEGFVSPVIKLKVAGRRVK